MSSNPNSKPPEDTANQAQPNEPATVDTAPKKPSPWEEAKRIESEGYHMLLAVFSETHAGDTDLPSGDGWKRVRCEAKPENASFVRKRAQAGWEIDEESTRKDSGSWVLRIRQEVYDRTRNEMLERISRLTVGKVNQDGGTLDQIRGATADELLQRAGPKA